MTIEAGRSVGRSAFSVGSVVIGGRWRWRYTDSGRGCVQVSGSSSMHNFRLSVLLNVHYGGKWLIGKSPTSRPHLDSRF